VLFVDDEAAVTIVAGNIRRSAGIRQSDSDDDLFANANLWQCDCMVTGELTSRDALMATILVYFTTSLLLTSALRLFANSIIPVKVQFNGLRSSS